MKLGSNKASTPWHTLCISQPPSGAAALAHTGIQGHLGHHTAPPGPNQRLVGLSAAPSRASSSTNVRLTRAAATPAVTRPSATEAASEAAHRRESGPAAATPPEQQCSRPHDQAALRRPPPPFTVTKAAAHGAPPCRGAPGGCACYGAHTRTLHASPEGRSARCAHPGGYNILLAPPCARAALQIDRWCEAQGVS